MSIEATLVTGYVLVDKPIEWSSHDVVGKIRNLLHVKRVGHAGTLDPMATGLLIVLVGREFTRLQDTFLKLDKVYEGEMELGWTTDTYDAFGTEVSRAEWPDVNNITPEQIKAAFQSWEGTHQQQVPAFSAVKHHGRKLYQLARYENESLPELPSREVTFYSIEVTHSHVLPAKKVIQVQFKVKCSSGTYIRSLVHDIGKQLHVGATLTALRRLQIGEFSIKDAVPPHIVTTDTLVTNL